jgi:hypothetical protein
MKKPAPKPAAAPATAKPVAWLIRESGGQNGLSPRVMSGRMFVTEASAQAAAKRMSGGRWTREAFPVFAAPPEA